MQNKSLRRNLVPATALTAGTTTSQVETDNFATGVRFYVTISGVTATGSNDSLFLCAQIPGAATIIPLSGFSAANMLCTAGTFCFDFYPRAWLPTSGLAASGQLLGVAGVALPMKWAVQLILGAGNAATITVNCEVML